MQIILKPETPTEIQQLGGMGKSFAGINQAVLIWRDPRSRKTNFHIHMTEGSDALEAIADCAKAQAIITSTLNPQRAGNVQPAQDMPPAGAAN